GYHQRCLEVCRKYDVLYISDEVVTAFGRLGHWFASEAVFGVQPDIITSAKGLTSGYLPLGACIVSDRLIQDLHGKKATFSNGFTYSAHPVSCAAALKNIEIMERENLMQHVQDITPHFQQRLEQLRQLPLVCDVRGAGLIGCVECSLEDGAGTLKQDQELGYQIDEECQKLGLIVRPINNMCVFSPPLIITPEQIDTMMDLLEQGIRNVMTKLGVAG
ncbi:MAG: aminotransferase class III-fold pyridoxal phosphate-dependent enzyme, partial [Thiolinea sp.]